MGLQSCLAQQTLSGRRLAADEEMGNKKPEKKDAAEKAAELAAKAQKYLVKAIQDDSVKAIESALKKGADLLSADEYGNTPLHVAAMYGSCHAIGYLHAHGADLSARNFAGCNLVPPKEVSELGGELAISQTKLMPALARRAGRRSSRRRKLASRAQSRCSPPWPRAGPLTSTRPPRTLMTSCRGKRRRPRLPQQQPQGRSEGRSRTLRTPQRRSHRRRRWRR